MVLVGAMDPFWPGDRSFRAVGGGGGGGAPPLWPASNVEGSVRERLAFGSLSCWEASVTLYLWFRF